MLRFTIGPNKLKSSWHCPKCDAKINYIFNTCYVCKTEIPDYNCLADRLLLRIDWHANGTIIK